jgi:hypothetical protein
VTEQRRRRQQQSAGVSGAVRDGLAVTGGGLRTSQQGGFIVSGFQLLGFLSLSLSDSVSPFSYSEKFGIFLFCSGTLHAHRMR